jgi:hypothetical protein
MNMNMKGVYAREQIDRYQSIRAEVFRDHPSEGGWTDLAIRPDGIVLVSVRRTRHAPMETYLIDGTGEIIKHSTL